VGLRRLRAILVNVLDRLAEFVASFLSAQDATVRTYAEQLMVATGRDDGEDETRIEFDRYLPNLTLLDSEPSPFDEEGPADFRFYQARKRARWRMRTSTAKKPLDQYRFSHRSSAMKAFHGAEADKGRRIAIDDLDNGQTAADRRVALLRGPGSPSDSQRQARRPQATLDGVPRGGRQC
jgi:hypothetical protein